MNQNVPLTLQEYAAGANSTRVYPAEFKLIYPALKLAGEAGEVAEKIGKQIRDKGADFSDPVFIREVTREAGDVLWYINAIAEDIGESLEAVARANLAKLRLRAQAGKLHGSGDNR